MRFARLWKVPYASMIFSLVSSCSLIAPENFAATFSVSETMMSRTLRFSQMRRSGRISVNWNDFADSRARCTMRRVEESAAAEFSIWNGAGSKTGRRSSS